jgi:hypothetical protein
MNEKNFPKKRHTSIWGIILLFLGVVFLLQNFNIIPSGLWVIAWRFWPLILIIFGINIIVGQDKPWLTAAITVALLVFGILAALLLYPRISEEIVRYSIPRGDYKEAVVELDFSAGSLSLSALPYGSPNLAEADSQGNGLRADSSSRNGIGLLSLKSVSERRMPHRMGWNEWNVELARDIPLSIVANLDAADLDFNLSNLNVTRLDLDLDAGNADIVMPSAKGTMHANIKADAANVVITIPEGTAAKIKADVDAGLLDMDESRFIREGAYYISHDFNSAKSRLYIEIDLNAGRVKVS